MRVGSVGVCIYIKINVMAIEKSRMPRVRNSANFVFRKEDMERVSGKSSLTVQDDSYTVREILEKYSHGVDPQVVKRGVFPEEDAVLDDLDLEKVGQLDLFDRSELARDYREALIDRIALRKKEVADKVAAMNKPLEEELEKPSVSRRLSKKDVNPDDDVTDDLPKGKKK